METKQTLQFADWLGSFRDQKTLRRIVINLAKLEAGLGDTKSVGDGVSELRMDFGPGYRAYFTVRGQQIIWLLCGGDKDSQSRDIERAKELAAQIE